MENGNLSYENSLINFYLVGGCIYPRDQISNSFYDSELRSDSVINSSNIREDISTNDYNENREDFDFNEKLNQKLHSLESNKK